MAVPAEVLRQVLGEYDLDRPRVTGFLEAGGRNDNFLIEDASGQRYVLRRCRRNRDPERIRFQVRLQRHLLAAGFPASRVLDARAGEVFVAGGFPWVLFSWVDGEEYDFSRVQQAAESGRVLALFHETTSSFDEAEVSVPHNHDTRAWWTRPEEELAALSALFAGQEADGELAWLRAWSRSVPERLPQALFDSLPGGWIHDDWHGRNMLFEEDRITGVFDFDPVRRGVYAEDIAYGVFMFARQFRGSARLREDFGRDFVRGYAQVRTLSAEERTALPVLAPLAWTPQAAYYAVIRADGEDAAALFRRHVATMRAMVDQTSVLARIAAG